MMHGRKNIKFNYRVRGYIIKSECKFLSWPLCCS